MADLTVQPAALECVKLPDYEEYEFDILAGAAAFFNGALIDLITQGGNAGKIDHADDTNFDRQFIGVALNNPIGGVTSVTAPNGRLRVARGLIVGGYLTLEAGTAVVGDFGRPMYIGAFDETVGDYSNVTALKQRFAGFLRGDKARTSFDSLYVPNHMQPAHNGLVMREGVSSLTGLGNEVAKAVTGLEEIVQVVGVVEHSVAASTAAVIQAGPHATAGSLDIDVYKADGTSGLVASTGAANVHWVAWGNILPVMA